MKKTLIITLEFPPQVGGIATYVQQLAEALEPEKTIVLAPKNKLTREWDKERKYKVVRKNPYWFIWPRWLRLFWQVFWLCHKEKIDIIFIHHALPVGYVAILIKKILKIPFLVFSHGTDISYATKSKYKILMLKKVINKAEKVFFNSKSLQKCFLRVLPNLEKKTDIIYPCPNENFLSRPDKDKILEVRAQLALEGKKVILTISRIDEGKGITHLARILPKLIQKNPNLVWLLIGDGPKRPLIMQQIQKNNLQNVVRYLGEIPHLELKKYYYSSDLFVLLSHPDEGREEGLGLVFLEAAACGLPVVAGRSGGVEEAVIHTQTGLVIDVYQELTVISAINELLNQDGYREKIGQQAQARIKQEFNWKQQLKKLEPFLKTGIQANHNIDLKF